MAIAYTTEPIYLLQWGRDLSIAELRREGRHMAKTEALQWGRDLSIAEFSTGSSGSSRFSGLQWGRDLSIAELSGGSGRSMIAIGRFNGAAIYRSRNCGVSG